MKLKVILIYVNLILVASTFQVLAKDDDDDEDLCTLRNGDLGKCGPYSSCIKDLVGQKIKICGHNSREAVICCPLKTTEAAGLRISEKKCADYHNVIRKIVGLTNLGTSDMPNAMLTVETCNNDGVDLIVGGERAKAEEFPHMAVIGWKDEEEVDSYKFMCGGSLISEMFVLTAAHCAADTETGAAPVIVRLGTIDLTEKAVADFEIDQFIKHPEYQPAKSKSNYNDIALIKLKKNITFSTSIRPACLWQSFDMNKTNAIATGFGAVGFSDDLSNELLKVTLALYNNTKCNEVIGSDKKIPNGIMDTQLCAGDLKGKKDTCQGDSGGPLQIYLSSKCIFYIVGVTSFGKFCGIADNLGVYTRTYSYLEWIEEIVWSQMK